MRRTGFTMLAAVLPLATIVVTGSGASAAGGDRPDTRAAAEKAAVSPNGKWLHESLSSNGDRDWFRFHASVAGRALVTLGHLPGNYSLTVVDSHGSDVASADRSGRKFEEVYTALKVGDYFVQVAANSGARASVDYVLKFRPLADRVVMAEQKEVGDVDGFDIKGELLNNTSQWMQLFALHVTWLDAQGHAVGSVDEGIRPGPIAPRARAEFTIKHKRVPEGDLPKSATSYRIKIDAGKTNERTPTGLVMKPTSSGVDGPQHSRVYEGTVTNNSHQTMHEIYPTVIEYDGRGRANAFAYDVVHMLAPGESANYKMFAGNARVSAPNAIRLFASITGS